MRTLAAGIVAIVLGFNVQAQSGGSALSGTATASNGCTANQGTGIDNTSVGCNTGMSTMTGTANTCMGYSVGVAITSGSKNTFVGAASGVSTTTVSANTYVGAASGALANGSNNTFMGASAGLNCSENENVAIGVKALFTMAGGYAYGITAGSVAVGNSALYNGIGTSNTALGYQAGYTNTTGGYNTYLGNAADCAVACSTSSNMTAIGNGAVVSSANTILLGNITTTLVTSAVGSWSDGRFKTNVTENVKGLAFIEKLRPVTYKMNTQALDDYLIQGMQDSIKILHKAGMDFAPSMAIVHSGLIAQEVEQAGKDVGFVSSIVHAPSNSNDPYSVNYAEIVVPLVKAVQELSHKVDSLLGVTQGAGQRTKQNNNGGTGDNKGTSSINVELSNADVVILNEAAPNPFAEQTLITFQVPDKYNKAQILFYDSNGMLIKSVDIQKRGKGQMYVFANDLTSGMYSYTLIVDGKVIDTKKMMKQ